MAESLLLFKFTPIAADARVLRQIRVFAPDYDVTTAGFGDRVPGVADHVPIPTPPSIGPRARVRAYLEAILLRMRAYRLLYWTQPGVRSARRLLRGRQFDRVFVNDLETIPLALRIAPGSAIHADLHEYFPGVHDDHPAWVRLRKPYYVWLTETYAPRVASVTTVAQGLVEAYRPHGVESLVVTNAPDARPDLAPRPVHGPLRLVHSGNATPGRALEITMRAVARADADVVLTMHLMPNDELYLAGLQTLADELGDKVVIRPPVPHSDLLDTLNAHDVGVFVLPPNSTNHALALPNKFFDFVQARLAVLVGPTPAMAELVDRHGLGFVAEGFTEEDIVTAVEALDPARVEAGKRASDAAARELSAETQSDVWRAAARALRPGR